MDLTFKALADANRRKLLDRLYACEGLTLSQLCADMDMRRQSVSKHLDILEEANLLSVVWRGREKHYYLNPVPIAEIGERWIDKFSKPRMDALLNLKRALEENSTPNPTQLTQKES